MASRIPGSDRTDELLALMRERILVFDGAMGTMLQSRDLGPGGFRRGRARGVQRKPRRDPAGCHPRCPPGLSRGRGRSHRDGHLQRNAGRAFRVRAGRPGAGAQSGGGRTGGPGGKRGRDIRSTAFRCRLHGPHQQGHQRHRRDHLRRTGRRASPNRLGVSSRAGSISSPSRPARTPATPRRRSSRSRRCAAKPESPDR